MVEIDVEIDDIFEQLQEHVRSEQELVATTETKENKLQSIKDSLDKLPTISSALFQKDAQQDSETSSRIIKINDPITKVLNQEDKSNTKDPTELKKKLTSQWFDIPAREITPELKRDLTILKNRSVLDPKRFYKKEKWTIPTNFQIGTIIESKSEFYSARLNRKQRGTSLTDELLKDTERRAYFKKKYNEIQVKKQSGGKAHYKKLQEKKKKF